MAALVCVLTARTAPGQPGLPQVDQQSVPEIITDILLETSPQASPSTAVEAEDVSPPPPTLSELVTAIVRESVPEKFEDNDDWGHTKRRWDGLEIKGFKTSRRWKDVNHGTWTRYSATLIQPDENLALTIKQLDPANPGETRFLITAVVRARGEGTFVQWTYGVKGINATVVADASIELQILLTLEATKQVSWEKLLPLLSLHPRIDDVQLRLRDFDVRKVGVLGGTAADILGDGSKRAVEHLIRRQQTRIRDKLQKKLDRWSPSL